MLLIVAEDETFMSYNRDMDARAVLNEGREAPSSSKLAYEWVGVHSLLLADKIITTWLSELDIIAKQAEA